MTKTRSLPSVDVDMAAISDDDVAKIIQALEARGFSVHKKNEAFPKVLLEEKYFRRIEKYSGESGKWQEWLFGVCVAVSGISPECVMAMEDVVKKAGMIRDITTLDELVNLEVKHKFGSELFGVLCSLTAGEANVVVRSVLQKGAGYCGFAALCMLSQRFNPKTPARILQFLTTVLNPAPVKDVRLLERAVEEWELKKGKLKVEFGEEFSDNVNVAILTGMIPRDLQDIVFQMGHAGEVLKYSAVRDKVMSIASHRAQMAVPTPMDIGQIGGQWEEEPDLWEGGEVDVDAVGKGSSCHRCGGWGHFARECSTPEGKGSKGKAKGKGEPAKGWGKGGAKAAGKGGFWSKGAAQGKGEPVAPKGVGPKAAGKGLGYQGTCWNCGVVGHKQAECPRRQPISEVAEEVGPQESSSVGGVWAISQVMSLTSGKGLLGQSMSGVSRDKISDLSPPGVGEGWHVVAGRQRPKAPHHQGKGIDVTMGRFGVLDICPVATQTVDSGTADVCGVRSEITVDSAAEESVCPHKWAEQFGTSPVVKGHELRLVNASGGKITHYGSRKVAFQADGAVRTLGMGFEVTDVKKPLMAVCRICEKGNVVQFGPNAQDNYIMNIASGEKLFLKRRGNSYVLPGEFSDVHPF